MNVDNTHALSSGEVAEKLKISKDTLRYYENEGLLPPIQRDKNNRRQYTTSDIEWIFLIKCLRDTDMPISAIKQYVSLLFKGGDESISERKAILENHKTFILDKIMMYQHLSRLIDKKLDFYAQALKSDENGVKCMDYADEWNQFKSIIGGIESDG